MPEISSLAFETHKQIRQQQKWLAPGKGPQVSEGVPTAPGRSAAFGTATGEVPLSFPPSACTSAGLWQGV